MRVLFVAHSFPRHPDDFAGRFLLTLARQERALGHDVHAVVPHAPGLAIEDEMHGVQVRRYRYGPDEHESLAYAGTMHDRALRSAHAQVSLARLLVAQRRATRREVARFRPDVIHAHWWFPAGLAVWPRSSKAPPYVVTSHGTDLFLLRRFRWARALAGPIVRGAAQVTVISSPLVPDARALGVPDDRISVIPMPLESTASDDELGPYCADGPIVFVGRLVERKGGEYAIRAMRELPAGARLRILGDGPQRGALEALARDLGIADRVEFAGFVPPSEVAETLAGAAALVLPAVTDWKGEQEGFGMAIVEALAAGVPVVATATGGIGDIIRDGHNGLLVPERDAVSLARAIQQITGDSVRAQSLRAAGRLTVRAQFAPEEIARRFSEVYQRATSRR